MDFKKYLANIKNITDPKVAPIVTIKPPTIVPKNSPPVSESKLTSGKLIITKSAYDVIKINTDLIKLLSM